jgi:hypothetical protein
LLTSVDSYPSGITDKGLREFARSLYQLTSGVENQIKIKLKNVGSERFGGAKVRRLFTSQTLGLSAITQDVLSDELTVPQLAVGQENEVLTCIVSPFIDGVLSLEFGLESGDSDPILLKRSEGDEPKNPTTIVFTVGKFTDILISYNLEEVGAKLDELLKRQRRRKTR